MGIDSIIPFFNDDDVLAAAADIQRDPIQV
jgi:hypothetical protein